MKEYPVLLKNVEKCCPMFWMLNDVYNMNDPEQTWLPVHPIYKIEIWNAPSLDSRLKTISGIFVFLPKVQLAQLGVFSWTASRFPTPLFKNREDSSALCGVGKCIWLTELIVKHISFIPSCFCLVLSPHCLHEPFVICPHFATQPALCIQKKIHITSYPSVFLHMYNVGYLVWRQRRCYENKRFTRFADLQYCRPMQSMEFCHTSNVQGYDIIL